MSVQENGKGRRGIKRMEKISECAGDNFRIFKGRHGILLLPF